MSVVGVSLSLQEKVLLIKVCLLWGSACRYNRRFYSLRYVSCGGQPVVTREGFTH